MQPEVSPSGKTVVVDGTRMSVQKFYDLYSQVLNDYAHQHNFQRKMLREAIEQPGYNSFQNIRKKVLSIQAFLYSSFGLYFFDYYLFQVYLGLAIPALPALALAYHYSSHDIDNQDFAFVCKFNGLKEEKWFKLEESDFVKSFHKDLKFTKYSLSSRIMTSGKKKSKFFDQFYRGCEKMFLSKKAQEPDLFVGLSNIDEENAYSFGVYIKSDGSESSKCLNSEDSEVNAGCVYELDLSLIDLMSKKLKFLRESTPQEAQSEVIAEEAKSEVIAEEAQSEVIAEEAKNDEDQITKSNDKELVVFRKR
jgi:hypothetical protein